MPEKFVNCYMSQLKVRPCLINLSMYFDSKLQLLDHPSSILFLVEDRLHMTLIDEIMLEQFLMSMIFEQRPIEIIMKLK